MWIRKGAASAAPFRNTVRDYFLLAMTSSATAFGTIA
jgi:hypothetical protein